MQKDFCLGSEWLYYKIYTGVRTADFILLERLNSIILDLEDRDIIQRWFFIRYKDTNDHIRIRFLVKNTNDLLKVIQSFYPVFNNLLEEKLVWNIQTDTYKREIERYGKATMIESEFLFWQNSKMIVKYLELKSSFSTQESPLLFSFYAIDALFDLFQLSNIDKLSLIAQLQISYSKEFEVTKEQKKEMDRMYRLLIPKMKSLLRKDGKNDFYEIINIVDNTSNQVQETILSIKNKIEISLHSFLSSHIHMMINRQYTSNQRLYELIIYDHLFRFYKSLNYQILN